MAKLSVHLKSGLLLIVLVRCVSSNGEQEILTEATPTETMENVMTTTIFATTIAETTRSTYGFSIVEPTTTVEPTTLETTTSESAISEPTTLETAEPTTVMSTSVLESELSKIQNVTTEEIDLGFLKNLALDGISSILDSINVETTPATFSTETITKESTTELPIDSISTEKDTSLSTQENFVNTNVSKTTTNPIVETMKPTVLMTDNTYKMTQEKLILIGLLMVLVVGVAGVFFGRYWKQFRSCVKPSGAPEAEYGQMHAVHTNLELEDARLIRQVSSKTNSSNVPSGYNVPNIVIEAGEDGGKYRV